MQQLALELVNNIPENDSQAYTNNSKDDQDYARSTVFIKDLNNIKITLKNTDTCSIFQSELLAIEAGLKATKDMKFGSI